MSGEDDLDMLLDKLLADVHLDEDFNPPKIQHLPIPMGEVEELYSVKVVIV